MRQLELVARFEEEKEQKAARAFQLAQQHVLQQKQKLTSLQQYRLDYLRQIQQNGRAGVAAKQYHQHLSFVGKLDKACEQQTQFVSQAAMVADQRKRVWMEQQKRRKAVDILIDKKQQEAINREARREQSMNDEFAMQKFFRAKLNK
ncbi:flagellar export protein FliJ [Alteromonas pelagimontana]|uniref:Flagellar FliJ protein n=1 Tax=Alteromonas pelagimontana TaxID=1858656 RepID=A0A6M4MFI0_9ALTE|nr:flagellar export protein FliJ [Alteromonas pelagimontana]QJR81859.1 flagellar export protein FliJ [Alteromonas pelagimontana]